MKLLQENPTNVQISFIFQRTPLHSGTTSPLEGTALYEQTLTTLRDKLQAVYVQQVQSDHRYLMEFANKYRVENSTHLNNIKDGVINYDDPWSGYNSPTGTTSPSVQASIQGVMDNASSSSKTSYSRSVWDDFGSSVNDKLEHMTGSITPHSCDAGPSK